MDTPPYFTYYAHIDARQHPGSPGVVYEVQGTHLDVPYSLTIQAEGPLPRAVRVIRQNLLVRAAFELGLEGDGLNWRTQQPERIEAINPESSAGRFRVNAGDQVLEVVIPAAGDFAFVRRGGEKKFERVYDIRAVAGRRFVVQHDYFEGMPVHNDGPITQIEWLC